MSLTARERQVVMLIAEGRGCREIGKQLGIAEATARKHRDNAVRKEQTGSQAALVARLARSTATA